MEDQSKLDFRQTLSALLRSNRRHVRYIQILACLAVVVAVAVPLAFRQHGVAMTTTETRLSCHYSGNGAHTHNADCYDDEGNLVCPLEERELHTHTDECYATERVLACGKEETAGHAHSADCYDAEGNLTCTLAEEPAHKHSDACYEERITSELICGLEEVTEEHVHGPACFETVQVPTPAQDLTGELKVKDENGNEHVALIAQVKAPEGTLPKGTTMRAEAVDLQARETPDGPTVQDKLDEALLAEAGEAAAFTQTDAVKITFYDEQGNRVDPADKVEVLITTSAIRTFSDQRTAGDEAANDNGLLVLRVPDAQHGDAASAEVVRGTGLVNRDEKDASTGHEDTVFFEADSSSVYVVARVDYAAAKAKVEAEAQPAEAEAEVQSVESEAKAEVPQAEPKQEPAAATDPTHPAQSFTHRFTNSGGKELLRVDVVAPEGAFPTGTTMKVKWVDAGDVEGAVSEAVSGRTDGKLLGMCAVDITFLDPEGNEIEPAKKITVTFGSDFIDTEDDSYVVHIDDKGKGEVVDSLGAKELEKRDMPDEADELVFESDAFSTYVVAVTTLRKELAASDGKTYDISVDAPAEAGIPQDAELSVSEIVRGTAGYEDYLNRALQALGKDAPAEGTASARFFDIKIMSNGEEVQPQAPVKVSVQLADAAGATAASAVHFESDAKGAAEVMDATQEGDVTTFDATGFSVYGVIYTVDFHWDVDGKAYDYSIQGGDAQSLRELLVALKVVEDVEADAFMAQVSDVAFSDPELVNVAKVEENTTAGALKKELKLQPEYSDELTEEDIAAMDAKELTAGDWALVSLKAFDTIESLTVTMANGDAFAIRVTDAQISTMFLSDSGELFEVTVTYGPDAQIPDGATLKVTEFDEGTEDYIYARNTVLADKQAKGEPIDFSNLAALDISILDANGNKIEPAAPVQVDMKIKALPGVSSLDEVASTLAIEHHVETGDGVVVETVYDGGTEANFRMDTNEAVAAAGTAVDPNAADVSQFVASSFELRSDGSIVAAEPEAEFADDEIDVSFPTPVFSTFTVTWGSSSGDNSGIHVMASSIDDGSYIIYAKDAANGKYYALVPSTNLRTVEITLDSNNQVVYTGSENLYWTVDKHNMEGTYEFYFREGNNSYYLSAGNNQVKVRWGHNNGNYGSGENTTRFKVWDGQGYSNFNHIYSADGTFLQSYNGVFRFNTVSGFWYDNYQIYFERQGATPPSVPHATIHYVDEDGNDLPVSKGSISSSSLLNNTAYLIYDIEGGEYEYKETYLRRGSTNYSINPYLYWNSSNWYMTNGSGWAAVDEDDDIYVVYKKKKTPSEGGTPTLVELDENEKPEAPTVTKGSEVNHDGTNTLSLSVTSHTTPREVLKLADVVVIFDNSGSMGQEIDSENYTTDDTKQRMALLKSAVNQLASDLIGDNSAYIYTDTNGVKHKQIEMSLVSFSNTATDATEFTDDLSTFTGWVGNLSANGGTNWEQALQKANEATVDSGRATFVIFVTDGEPTFRMSRMTDADDSLYNDISDYYSTYNVYGTGSSDAQKDSTEYGRNYRAALEQAKAIVGNNKNLYMIGVGPDVANLEQFNTDAGADGYYPVTSSNALTQAFEDIKKRIAAMAGYSDFKIFDGITDLTQTVQKSDLVKVNFADDDFTYYKGHEATAEDVTNGLASSVGEMVWESWSPASEDCEAAVYNETTGAVEWNMGTSFMPQEGYTYQVRFKVWPSQEAYDLLATLNNAEDPEAAYNALNESVRNQIAKPTTEGGNYTLKTNSDTSYNYKDATIVDGTVTTNGDDLLKPPGKFPNVDPLELSTRPLKVQKLWHNNYSVSREMVDHITMELYGVDSNGTVSQNFKTFTLSKDNNWLAENNYISYGLVTYNTTTNANAKIYETGHDFTLRETDDEAHYFELTAGVYRPMYINGTPTILERVDAAPAGMSSDVFHYSDGTHHYYRMDGKIYRDTGSDILMLATNTRRSYMDLNKVVVDKDNAPVVDGEEFEYKVTFTVPEGIDNYETLEKYIWFSVRDASGRTLAPSEYTYNGAITPAQEDPVAFSGPEYANYLVATSGQPMTIKIKQGWNVRFLNLPIGTTYSFEEVNISEGYDFVKAEVSGTRWIANMVGGKDEGAAENMTSLPSNTSGNNSNTSISGTIDYANARYKTTYTNKALTKQVNVLKTNQEGTTPLSGAVFSLYTESGYAANPKQASKTELTSGSDGIIELGKLTVGKYYLVETSAPAGYIPLSDPVEITVSSDGVTYIQKDYSLSQSNNGISYDQATDTYTLTVTNNAGVELPAAGGPGTYLHTLCGLALFAAAGYVGIASRRKEGKEVA